MERIKGQQRNTLEELKIGKTYQVAWHFWGDEEGAISHVEAK